MASTLDVQYARSQFPSLESGYVFADSAGGSQALKSVADATRDYLLYSNAQLGASYPTSQCATNRVNHGGDAAAVLFNADSAEEIAFGHSTTQLLANLSATMAPTLQNDDEIIVTGEHEANVGPWKRLAASMSLKINTWYPSSSNPKNPYAVSYNNSVPALLDLVTPHTRIVALSGCSNILGEMLDFVPVIKALRAKKQEVSNGGEGLWVVVDLVAFAPHRNIDVKEWDVDFAVFSFYKVYGPHTAVMYTRRSELGKIGSVAHHFHSPRYDHTPVKLQPGGPGYELTYSSSAVLPYFYRLAQPSGHLIDSEELLSKTPKAELRKALKHTSELIQGHEDKLTKALLDYLTSSRMYERGVRIAGPETLTLRAPTISFLVVDTDGGKGLKSKDIVEYVDTKGTIGIRWGHFYAYSIIASLPGFVKEPSPGTSERSIDDGIVRISLVHYHTVADVQKIIETLDEILSK